MGTKALQAVFDPPTETAEEAPKPELRNVKSLRFSDKAPSIIEHFAPSALSVPLPDSPSFDGNEYEYEDDGDAVMGNEEIAKRMEEEGIEVVMIYEEDPEAEAAVEGGH